MNRLIRGFNWKAVSPYKNSARVNGEDGEVREGIAWQKGGRGRGVFFTRVSGMDSFTRAIKRRQLMKSSLC